MSNLDHGTRHLSGAERPAWATPTRAEPTLETIANRRTAMPSAPANPEFRSKSDHMRHLFDQGKTVAEVANIVGVDHAFAYGVAKRAGKAETAASRRKPAASQRGTN